VSKKLESKTGIEHGIKERKRGIDDRVKAMGLVVNEKKRIADASRKLRLSTTSEGADAIRRSVDAATQAVHATFTEQESDINGKFKECKTAEDDLHGRAESARKDASVLGAAVGQVKEAKGAKNDMEKAMKAAKEDAGYTDRQGKRQEKDRSDATRRRDSQKNQLMNTKLAW